MYLTFPSIPKHTKRKSVTPDIMLDSNTHIIFKVVLSLRIQTGVLEVFYTGILSLNDPLKTLDLPTICNKTFDAKRGRFNQARK